jgi:polyhydroxyalkanoate synthesis repressor PhaR
MLAQNENTRIVKKYQNRKLYDTKDSCYITLDDIAKMVKRGEEVKVVDNKTKGDVTSIILTQILVEQEKATKSILPLTMLRDIIQKGQGSLFDFIQRYVILGVNSTQEKSAEAERYINRLVDRGDISKVEGKNLLKEVLDAPSKGQQDFDDFIGNRVTNLVKETTKLNTLQDSIEALQTKLQTLESKVSKL